MNCTRESKHFDGLCAVPAEFLFTGPSGMSNALCGYHMKLVLKKWTFHQGFTIETLLTLGPPMAHNLNIGKE